MGAANSLTISPNLTPAAVASDCGNFFLDDHQDVDERRDEVEREDDLPVHAADQDDAQKGAGDHAARPSGVQDVQVVRLLLAIEGGDQRIDDGLTDAVRDREDEDAPEQAEVGAGAGGVGVGRDVAAVHEGRRHRHDDRQHVEDAREHEERLVAEPVQEQARDEDHDAEPDEAAPRDLSELRLREAELLSPLEEEPAADGEAESGNEDGQEARDQKFRVVHGPSAGRSGCRRRRLRK